MQPVSFHEQEQTLHGPAGQPDVVPLPVLFVSYADHQLAIVSCWRPSIWDLLRMVWLRRIYLIVLGHQSPPVLLSTDAKEIGLQDIAEPAPEVDLN